MGITRWKRISGLVAAVVLTSSALVGGGPVAAAGAQSGDGVIVFDGGGWGHGVGMSQYGAKGRALAGQSAAQILDFYYPGAPLETRSLGGPRVGLGEPTAVELTVRGGSLRVGPVGGASRVIAGDGQAVRVQPFSTAVIFQQISPTVGNFEAAATGPAAFSWSPGATVTVSTTGRAYTFGTLRAIPVSGSLRVVLADLSMDQYLYGLGEVPASWPTEALRSQAIAGRSFAAYRLAHPRNGDFDLYASVSDQAYVGTTQTAGPSGANWIAAVDSTSGQVLTSGGSVIQAFYSSSNGGYTARSDYVWSATLPYLIARPDPFDQVDGNNNFSWRRGYTPDQLGNWLRAAGRGTVGSVTSVSIGGNVGTSGRTDRATVTVVGTAGRATMTGNQFRAAVNAGAPSATELPSTKFAIGQSDSATAPPPPPRDTTAPRIAVLSGNPMRYGSVGRVCGFVVSDETAITAIAVRIGRTDLRSPVGGVFPDRPALLCVEIPRRLRGSRTTGVTLIGAAIDASANLSFALRPASIAR
ncbi:MAG: SpoIID/LytB domain-containing protein [Microthrixaceae bacterium]